MTYTIRKGGAGEVNEVNSSLVSTCNCTMVYCLSFDDVLPRRFWYFIKYGEDR